MYKFATFISLVMVTVSGLLTGTMKDDANSNTFYVWLAATVFFFVCGTISILLDHWLGSKKEKPVDSLDGYNKMLGGASASDEAHH